jgi:hypothetical protein
MYSPARTLKTSPRSAYFFYSSSLLRQEQEVARGHVSQTVDSWILRNLLSYLAEVIIALFASLDSIKDGVSPLDGSTGQGVMATIESSDLGSL